MEFDASRATTTCARAAATLCVCAALFSAAAHGAAARVESEALARAKDALSKMTLEEKISLCAAADTQTLPPAMRAGILKDWQVADISFVASGEGNFPGTLLPSMAAVASTWNTSLAGAAGDVIGAEARALGNDMVLAPSVQLALNPLDGGNIWRFGEDPVLASRLAKSMIQSIQSNDVASCVGIYDPNAGICGERARREIYMRPFRAAVREGGAMGVGIIRNDGASRSDELNFRAATGFDGMFVDAGSDTFATTNDVEDGRIAASDIEERALRTVYTMEKLKFLDGEARRAGELRTPKHQTNALAIAEEAVTLLKNDAATLPLKAGLMKNILVVGELAETALFHTPGSETTPVEGLERYFEGKDVEIVKKPMCVDANHNLSLMPSGAESGAIPEEPWEVEWFNNAKEPQEIAYKTQRAHRPGFAPDATVPLDGMNKSAFCVRWSTRLKAAESGNYMFRCLMDETGGVSIVLDGKELASGTACGKLECTATLNEGEAYQLSVTYSGSDGAHAMRFGWLMPSELKNFEELRQCAEKADAVLVFTGTQLGSGRAMEGFGGARPDMRLLPWHDATIEGILSWKSQNVIVVVNSASPVELPWCDDCATLIHTPYLGEAAGDALAKVLFGDIAPSGKLPFTWPKRMAQTPYAPGGPATAEDRMAIAEGLHPGYRWFDKKEISPLFPFGHGTTYTKFLYDMDKAEIAKFAEDDSWAVSLPVKNIGSRAAKEAVQIYAAYPNAKEERPVKELKGFAKTHMLAPGEQETLTVRLRPRDLAYWDPFLCRFRLDAGEYQLIVAASAADIRGKAKVTIATDYVFEE